MPYIKVMTSSELNKCHALLMIELSFIWPTDLPVWTDLPQVFDWKWEQGRIHDDRRVNYRKPDT